MAIPRILCMDSLGSLDRIMPRVAIKMFFLGAGPKHSNRRRHFVNIIRLTDLSIAEYKLSRDHILKSMQGGDDAFLQACDAVDHMEICIITAARAIQSIRSSGLKKSGIPEVSWRNLEQLGKTILDVRNAILHIDGEIGKSIPVGRPHALALDDTGSSFSIAGIQLAINDIELTLRHLHAASIGLSTFKFE